MGAFHLLRFVPCPRHIYACSGKVLCWSNNCLTPYIPACIPTTQLSSICSRETHSQSISSGLELPPVHLSTFRPIISLRHRQHLVSLFFLLLLLLHHHHFHPTWRFNSNPPPPRCWSTCRTFPPAQPATSPASGSLPPQSRPTTCSTNGLPTLTATRPRRGARCTPTWPHASSWIAPLQGRHPPSPNKASWPVRVHHPSVLRGCHALPRRGRLRTWERNR
jgi:hypothetical protein